MYQSARKKLLVVFIIAAVLIFGAVSLLNYINSFQNIKVSYKNVASVSIFDTSNAIDGEEKTAASNVRSGDEVRLKKGHSYAIRYTGADGYESGERLITPLEEYMEITLEPSVSKEKLERMLDSELTAIHQQIKNRYPAISLYEIQRGRLLEEGDWYATTLRYIGPDVYNSDTLRIVLQKNGTWQIKTDPPNISLSKRVYTDVPEDVLREANSL